VYLREIIYFTVLNIAFIFVQFKPNTLLMKKILAVLLALCLFVPDMDAQDDDIRPAAIGVSFFLNDFVTASRIRSSSLSQVLRDKQWSKTRDMAPGVAISYFKGLRKHVDFAGTLAGSFLRYPFPKRPAFSSDRFLLEADASMNFKMVSERYWVQPYLIAGIGGHMYGGKYFGAFIPTGLGMKLNLFDEAQIFVTTQYRIPVTAETSNYHFFNQFGIAGRIGEKKKAVVIVPPAPPADQDKDGIIDSLDKCPTVAGIEKYQGCPVPDTDKDGINDDEDKCPSVAGLARYQGCPVPDTDKDGINDEEDKCINEAGPAANQGCPFVDTDKDGIPDPEDKCPTLPGTKENQGCPAIQEEIVKRIDYAASNIYFATGKFILLSKSNKGLDEVAKLLNENTDLKLAIDGHTDDVGKDETNQLLSEKRAAAVKSYLVKKGVDESRLTVNGYGETKPIADNKTATGRQKNRRVELELSYF
jgi:outer membrane protein OmpA-like peptidoglycan-associated protein